MSRIWRAILLILASAILGFSGPPPLPVGQIGDWKLLFSDDFDGQSLDAGKWTTCYWWKQHWRQDDGCTNEGTGELQWYQADDVLVGDGILKLRAQQRTTFTETFGQTFAYTSGMITSGRIGPDTSVPAKFVFQYGYAEIRARLPRGQGLWPAFWLLPANHGSTPEIDVMEVLGQDPDILHMNFHYRNSDGIGDSAGSSWEGPDFSAGWHTFAVDWQPKAIIWYVDGIERWRYTDRSHLPSTPMYLLANLAVEGDWPEAPDAGTPFPSYYEIDYVRVWQRSSDTPPTVTITAPSDGSTVSGRINVTADASDDVRVTKVELYIDGALRESDTTSPYSYSWDSVSYVATLPSPSQLQLRGMRWAFSPPPVQSSPPQRSYGGAALPCPPPTWHAARPHRTA